MPTRTEMYGLFAVCIPQTQRGHFQAQPRRKRQNLIPNILLTMQWGGTGPERCSLLEVATDEHRCRAVLRRAEAPPGEYAPKAQQIDRKFCGTGAIAVGPVEAKLRSF